jgi:hypothetical protein
MLLCVTAGVRNYHCPEDGRRSGASICDATEGGYSEPLFPSTCVFFGAFERPGTYVVRVARAGDAPAQAGPVNVVMDSATCPHVQEVRLEVSLSPAP